jgi:DNA-binding IclR family transcriptional regulator
MLGLTLVRWGAVAVSQLDLRTVARPILTALAAELGEICHMGVMDWQDMKVAYIDKIESARAIPVRSQVGSHMDAHSTALGKLLLAHATLNDQMRFLRSESLVAHTPNTITDTDRLFRELVRIRSVGYAVDREENEPGILCVAAPVRDFRGAVIAAVSATGLMDVSPEHVEKKVKRAREAAGQISHAMGAPDDETVQAGVAAEDLEAAGIRPLDQLER